MNHLKKFFLLFSLFFVLSCSSVPKNTVNACAIFNEKYLWYKFAKATERNWGVPIELQMAIIRKESGYDWLARPERTKLFKVIPWKRKSSSLGYSQAIEDTWETYKKSTGKKYVTRVLFKDASDFVETLKNVIFLLLKKLNAPLKGGLTARMKRSILKISSFQSIILSSGSRFG